MIQDTIKNAIFAGKMPEMPQNYREFFNVAFMFRRKYLEIPLDRLESVYEAATNDMQTICDAYDNDPFCMGLLLECYDDIVRNAEESIRNAEKNERNRPKQCSMAF